jgi:hypothetical protein
MQAGSVTKIEKRVDRAASAVFALACGYAAYLWFAPHVARAMLWPQTCASAVFAYLLSVRALSVVKPKSRKLPVPVFDVRSVEPFEEFQLRLIASDQAAHVFEDDSEPLVLDDRLIEPGSDARVVRLFDAAAMPPSGASDTAIERLSGLSSPPIGQEDASQALHEALAELRRSLR